MATRGHDNFVGGADVTIGSLLMRVAGGQTLIPTGATTDVPTHISLNTFDFSEDPANALEYERLEYGKEYILRASAEIASGAAVACDADGEATTQAGAGNHFFLAMDADGSAANKAFSAQFVGAQYNAS